MAQTVAQFFSIIIPDMPPPSNMLELIPYLLTVTVGVFLVSGVFRVVTVIVGELFSMRRSI
jgi:hypothetical protein